MAFVSLCMIVKDESHIIARCLDSVKPLIDYVFIVDTGSSDNTEEIINNWMADNMIPGEVLHEPWRNFSYNRSFALKEMRKREFVDYALMIDADEILLYESGFDAIVFKSSMDCDIYNIETRGGVVYNRPTLTSNRLDFRYEGIVHEFLALDGGPHKHCKANGFYNCPIQDSNRNKSENKYAKDAELLEEAIKNPENDFFKSRYTFYLAQSYRDSGDRENALRCYNDRSTQGFWQEEVFYSLYSAAILRDELGHPREEVLQAYMKAYESLPIRAEPLHRAMVLCRYCGWNHQGYLIGKQAMQIGFPEDSLFVEKWVYDYGILDEYAGLAYWSGRGNEAMDVARRIISEKKAPLHYIERISNNLNLTA